jgi:hypothetical protein
MMADQFKFDRSLYLPEAVDAAVAAYAEHAKIEVTRTGDEVVAVLSEVTANEPTLVAKSFCNHVLYETVVRMRRAAAEKSD